MKPICLLDIDGVLNPLWSDLSGSDWLFEPSFVADDFTMRFSKQMLDALQALPMEIQWLTTWCQKPDNNNVYKHLEPVLNLPRFKSNHELSNRRPTQGSWWKHDVVEQLLIKHPWYQRFVWIDDDLNDFHVDTLDNDRVLLIRPDTAVGITKAHIARIREFCEAE